MTISVGVGGIWRAASTSGLRVGVGGAWHPIIKISVGVAGVWRQAYLAQDDFSITAGAGSGLHGYSASPPIGSITGATLGDGKVITACESVDVTGDFVLQVSGFSVDPGTNYITSLDMETNGGLQNLLPAGATYGYSAGVAQWTWASRTWGFNTSTAYAGVLIRT